MNGYPFMSDHPGFWRFPVVPVIERHPEEVQARSRGCCGTRTQEEVIMTPYSQITENVRGDCGCGSPDCHCGDDCRCAETGCKCGASCPCAQN